MKRDKTLDIGSYSSGTMREEDLIPTFLSVADGLRLSRADRKEVNRIARAANAEDYYESDDASEDCQTLFDVLGNYTPDYCYFGAHPGDGADYGVWVVEDLFTDTFQGSYDGCVYRLSADEDLSDVDKSYAYALQVNDHGNVTLYRRVGKRNQWREVWTIV